MHYKMNTTTRYVLLVLFVLVCEKVPSMYVMWLTIRVDRPAFYSKLHA